MSRSHVLRKSLKKHDVKRFAYPFSEIGSSENYLVKNFVKPLITQSVEEATSLAGNFPKNIDQWLWSSPGQNDENPWLLLCRLKTGVYAFYRAGCDYTGFDCQGRMDLTVSRNLAEVIEYGMHDADYSIYMEQTTVV